jgi:hypothetical protein
MCLALLIALAPALHAFAMVPHASAGALLETPDHSESQVASQAGEAAATSTRAHQHGDENLAIDGGTCGCLAFQSIDLCTLVCCAAILSQSPDHTGMGLTCKGNSLLTIPSSVSRRASHPPPEAIV